MRATVVMMEMAITMLMVLLCLHVCVYVLERLCVARVGRWARSEPRCA